MNANWEKHGGDYEKKLPPAKIASGSNGTDDYITKKRMHHYNKIILCVVIKVLKSVNHSLLSKYQHIFIACCSISSIVDFPPRILA